MVFNEISEESRKKLQLYCAAMYLFEQGKSHPQIVNLLEKIEPDPDALTVIVDKAMREEWDKLYQEARELFSKDMLYEDVLKIISQKEPDKEIASWICGTWYEWKSAYMQCVIDGPTNRLDGMKGMIACSIGVLVAFLIPLSWLAKTIWIVAFVACTIQWFVGMQQRSLASKINHLFTTDLDEFASSSEHA